MIFGKNKSDYCIVLAVVLFENQFFIYFLFGKLIVLVKPRFVIAFFVVLSRFFFLEEAYVSCDRMYGAN